MTNTFEGKALEKKTYEIFLLIFFLTKCTFALPLKYIGHQQLKGQLKAKFFLFSFFVDGKND